MAEPTKYLDDGITPTLAYWRSLFVFYGLTVAYADSTYKRVVHDSKWISRWTMAQNVANYRKRANGSDLLPKDATPRPIQEGDGERSPLDPRQEELWRTRRRREQAEREYAAAMADPATRAEIDEIRNRVLHKVAHLQLGQ